MSTALVTGGSAGIGREIVKRLLARGDEVISLDVQATDLRVSHYQGISRISKL
jgi:NAD(P)-dependent dehydrogenase (short-subunit alcohol dehydrogenase family)